MMSISSIEALRGKAFAAQSLVERTELPFATHPLAPTIPYSRIAHDVRPTSCFIGLLAVPIQSRTLIRALTAFHCIPRGHGRQDPARNRIQVRWRAQRWRRVGSRVLWLCSQFLDFIFGPCEHAIDRRLYSAHDAVDDMAHRGACVCLVFGGCGRRRLCGRWRLFHALVSGSDVVVDCSPWDSPLALLLLRNSASSLHRGPWAALSALCAHQRLPTSC